MFEAVIEVLEIGEFARAVIIVGHRGNAAAVEAALVRERGAPAPKKPSAAGAWVVRTGIRFHTSLIRNNQFFFQDRQPAGRCKDNPPATPTIRPSLVVKTSFEPESTKVKSNLRESLARRIGAILFYSLLALIALVAIPYGTAEPWWKALFQCVVFVLTGLCIIGRSLWRDGITHERSLFWPALALIAFGFLQTLSWSEYSIGGIDNIARTLSADPFQTQLFLSQVLALLLAGWLLVLNTSSRKRVGLLIETVILVGVISAGFGILRQAIQNEVGFVLPYLRPGFGYGQFINSNHFVFLMEMALGLDLGIVVCRGVSKRRTVLYVMAAIPMWLALILANSRAGILSILCQVLFLGLVAGSKRNSQRTGAEAGGSRAWFRTSRALAVRVLLVIALLAGAVITIVLFGGEPLARKAEVITVELNPKTAETYILRLNIWQATLGLIKEHPIGGVGFGAYWIAISRYHHASGEITPQEAHSDYLELAAGGGLIGLAIGIWFTLAFVLAARRKIRAADRYSRAVTLGALTGIMTVAIHSIVDFGLHITINALILTTLVSIVVMNVREEPTAGKGNG